MNNEIGDEKKEFALKYISQKGPLTTDEIVRQVSLRGFDCNDKSVEVLPMLEKEGKIKKSFDSKKKTFVWSVYGDEMPDKLYGQAKSGILSKLGKFFSKK